VNPPGRTELHALLAKSGVTHSSSSVDEKRKGPYSRGLMTRYPPLLRLPDRRPIPVLVVHVSIGPKRSDKLQVSNISC
jgi:hypothetical protein